MLERCGGDAVEMRWRCGGDAVEMRWRCGRDAVEMLGTPRLISYLSSFANQLACR